MTRIQTRVKQAVIHFFNIDDVGIHMANGYYCHCESCDSDVLEIENYCPVMSYANMPAKYLNEKWIRKKYADR